MEKKIPIGVKIIALVDFLIGLILLLIGISSTRLVFQITDDVEVQIIATILIFLVCFISIWVGLGILKFNDSLRRGNRIHVISYMLFLFMIHPYGHNHLHGHNFEVIFNCFRIGFFFTLVWMVIYLGLPKVKEQFK